MTSMFWFQVLQSFKIMKKGIMNVLNDECPEWWILQTGKCFANYIRKLKTGIETSLFKKKISVWVKMPDRENDVASNSIQLTHALYIALCLYLHWNFTWALHCWHKSVVVFKAP